MQKGYNPERAGESKGVAPILIIILVAILGIGGYFVYTSLRGVTSLSRDNEAISPSPTPQPSPNQAAVSPVPSGTGETANWKTYSGTYLTFQYPNDWNPVNNPLCCGAVLEDVKLNIPGVTSDQTMGFSSPLFKNIKPNDVLHEYPITISNQPGFKWIRKGDNYISYDYCTNGHYQAAGSFCLHVTTTYEDKNLADQLDKVSESIKFTK